MVDSSSKINMKTSTYNIMKKDNEGSYTCSSYTPLQVHSKPSATSFYFPTNELGASHKQLNRISTLDVQEEIMTINYS